MNEVFVYEFIEYSQILPQEKQMVEAESSLNKNPKYYWINGELPKGLQIGVIFQFFACGVLLLMAIIKPLNLSHSIKR